MKKKCNLLILTLLLCFFLYDIKTNNIKNTDIPQHYVNETETYEDTTMQRFSLQKLIDTDYSDQIKPSYIQKTTNNEIIIGGVYYSDDNGASISAFTGNTDQGDSLYCDGNNVYKIIQSSDRVFQIWICDVSVNHIFAQQGADIDLSSTGTDGVGQFIINTENGLYIGLYIQGSDQTRVYKWNTGTSAWDYKNVISPSSTSYPCFRYAYHHNTLDRLVVPFVTTKGVFLFATFNTATDSVTVATEQTIFSNIDSSGNNIKCDFRQSIDYVSVDHFVQVDENSYYLGGSIYVHASPYTYVQEALIYTTSIDIDAGGSTNAEEFEIVTSKRLVVELGSTYNWAYETYTGNTYINERGTTFYYRSKDSTLSIIAAVGYNSGRNDVLFFSGSEFTATYDFNAYDVGDTGTDIDFVDSIDASLTATIDNVTEGHFNPLKIVSTGTSQTLTHTLSSAQASGKIELWYYFETLGSGNGVQFKLIDGSSNYIGFEIIEFSGYYQFSITNLVVGSIVFIPVITSEFQNYKWHYVSIEFDASTDICYITIDNELFTNAGNEVLYGNIETIEISFDDTDTMWFDAIGYTFDVGYSEGDNLYPAFELYSFQNNITNEFSRSSMCVLETMSYSRAYIQGDIDWPSNMTLELYDDQATPDLLHRGLCVAEKGYDANREFFFEGVEAIALRTKITLDYSITATEVATILKAGADQCPHIWYDATSIPNTSLTFKTKHDDSKFQDLLRELANFVDAIWYIEPSGRLWFLKITAQVDSGITLTQASGGFRPPTFEYIPQTPNYIKIYVKDYVLYTAEDAESRLLNGDIEVSRYYPNVSDATKAQDIADSLLARDGVATPPLTVEFFRGSQNYQQPGEYMSFQFTFISRLAVATNYTIQKLVYPITKGAFFLLTNSLLQIDD